MTEPRLHDQLLAISILRNADEYLCKGDEYWCEDRYEAIEAALRILRSCKLLVVRESKGKPLYCEAL